jgi:hypothetical protein
VMMCGRCGAGPAGYELFDYCGLCGTKLCDECMAAGCCGHAPAVSGREQEREMTPSGSNDGGAVRSAPAPKKKRAQGKRGRKAAASRPRS